VLFVDDEENVLQGMKRSFHDMRHEWDMSFASGGEEALRLVDAQPFDVVVSDMRMPGMDGGKLLAEVQRRRPETLRLILSGHSDREMIMRTVKPAHQFLLKPIEPEDLKRCIRRATLLHDVFLDDAVRSVVSQIETLPSVPKIFTAIREELAKDNASLKTVSELIAQDVGMTANILKLVNSAFFGLRTHVTSPTHAVNLLGTEIIKSLILYQQAFSQFDRARYPDYDLELLWGHSLTTGHFAKTIAAQEGVPVQCADDCYIAGLMHDVGKLILASNFEGQYRQVLGLCREQNRTVWVAEKEVFGTSHAEVGAYLLGLWGLSDAIMEAVYHHHDPRGACGGGFSPLLAVHVANCLQHEFVVINRGYARNQLQSAFLEEAGLLPRLDAWREACAQASLTEQEEATG
jgi:HD-like signal output (HDOD) protein